MTLHALRAEPAPLSQPQPALREYVAQAKDSWHTPGHGGGDSFKGSPWVGDFYDFVGEQMLRADLDNSLVLVGHVDHPAALLRE